MHGAVLTEMIQRFQRVKRRLYKNAFRQALTPPPTPNTHTNHLPKITLLIFNEVTCTEKMQRCFKC